MKSDEIKRLRGYSVDISILEYIEQMMNISTAIKSRFTILEIDNKITTEIVDTIGRLLAVPSATSCKYAAFSKFPDDAALYVSLPSYKKEDQVKKVLEEVLKIPETNDIRQSALDILYEIFVKGYAIEHYLKMIDYIDWEGSSMEKEYIIQHLGLTLNEDNNYVVKEDGTILDEMTSDWLDDKIDATEIVTRSHESGQMPVQH